MKKISFILVLLLMAFGCTSTAQLAAKVIKDGLFIPWEIIYGPDDHIWFTQKDGYVCRLDPLSGELDTIYHESRSVIRGEGGMLGMAMHPSFAEHPYVYIAYNYENEGNYKLCVSRYLYEDGQLSSPVVLLDGINAGSVHNGCRLLIVDDKLFITTGDAAQASSAQDVSGRNGKILRLNLDGSIPADNPVAGSPVWSWGHRNAQGLCFHNGIMYSSEHGPDKEDEFNIIHPGRNYGWPDVEGFCDLPEEITFCEEHDVVEPLYSWTPTLAVSSIAYYHHPMFSQFNNTILMTTLKAGQLLKVELSQGRDSVLDVSVLPGVDYGRLRAITISPAGRIYLSTSNSNASGNGARQDKIIELSDSMSTGIGNYAGDKEIILYPNPAKDKISFLFPDKKVNVNGGWTYSISNIAGEIITEGTMEYNSIPVDLLFSGIYLLRLWKPGEEMIYRQFVKW